MLKKKSFYYFLPNPNSEEEGPSATNSTQKKTQEKCKISKNPMKWSKILGLESFWSWGSTADTRNEGSITGNLESTHLVVIHSGMEGTVHAWGASCMALMEIRRTIWLVPNRHLAPPPACKGDGVRLRQSVFFLSKPGTWPLHLRARGSGWAKEQSFISLPYHSFLSKLRTEPFKNK
jgi:hypothetical protein